MKFIVPVKYIQAAMVCVADKDVRYYLNGVHFDKNRIESTDGHTMYIAYMKDSTPEWFTGGSEPKKVIVKIDGKIPKFTGKCQVCFAIFEIDGDQVTIRYTDFLGSQVAIGMGVVVSGRFPLLPKVLRIAKTEAKKIEKPVGAIGMNVSYLARLDKMFNDNRFNAVSMLTGSENSAVIFTNRRIEHPDNIEYFVQMPVRL